MNKEFSAGTIIFRRENGRVKFLLIYSGRNKVWGFPKGHIEPGETEKQAALREVKEETGIDGLSFVEGFREEDIYRTVSNRGESKGKEIEKHSVYFLCETKTGEITLDKEEIEDHKWVGIDEARKLLAFESLKRIFTKAQAISLKA